MNIEGGSSQTFAAHQWQRWSRVMICCGGQTAIDWYYIRFVVSTKQTGSAAKVTNVYLSNN